MFFKWVVKIESMFFKWVVVGRVKVGALPTPPENSAEGAVQWPCSNGTLNIKKVTSI
jgi:hypothetical protein